MQLLAIGIIALAAGIAYYVLAPRSIEFMYFIGATMSVGFMLCAAALVLVYGTVAEMDEVVLAANKEGLDADEGAEA